jgi:hypothetical protein
MRSLCELERGRQVPSVELVGRSPQLKQPALRQKLRTENAVLLSTPAGIGRDEGSDRHLAIGVLGRGTERATHVNLWPLLLAFKRLIEPLSNWIRPRDRATITIQPLVKTRPISSSDFAPMLIQSNSHGRPAKGANSVLDRWIAISIPRRTDAVSAPSRRIERG